MECLSCLPANEARVVQRPFRSLPSSSVRHRAWPHRFFVVRRGADDVQWRNRVAAAAVCAACAPPERRTDGRTDGRPEKVVGSPKMDHPQSLRHRHRAWRRRGEAAANPRSKGVRTEVMKSPAKLELVEAPARISLVIIAK